tara:strand:- start:1725 stop:3020 length:1296 start_codon:yes stop_codon:yes gene_type:complete
MIKEEDINIAVIGLGYVGLPLALEFSKKYNVVGFDIDEVRISELNDKNDCTNELSDHDLSDLKKIKITANENAISNSNIYIVTVPTPVDKNNKPNLNPIISASELIGGYLNKNDIVIYESTVFPGCTEELCVPILEKKSKLEYNSEFFCGYSPERINPGDKKYTLTNITKIVSGSNKQTLNIVNQLYESIISEGTFKASSICVAEAAKVIENTQRDVNIALVNELALIFDKLDINTNEVLEAASTKWNFLPFKPGLVGGHCIGVDPYYLTHKAIEVGYHPEIILAGRRINDNMGDFIAEKTISELTKLGISPLGANIAILGLSFKEGCPDLRNTKVISIINRLKYFNCNLTVSDSWVMQEEAKIQYGIELQKIEDIKEQDAIIIAVAHKEYLHLSSNQWERILRPQGLVIDVKSMFNKNYFSKMKFKYWSL